MKLILAISVAAVLALSPPAFAKGGSHGGSHASHSSGSEHAVAGHTTKNGTHVAPHHATNPNNTKHDNYSSKGNVNPHTGKEGTKDPNKNK